MAEPTSTPAMAWGAATDTGRVRSENEDAFVAEAMVFGVADGMGGHQAGEVASAIAADTLRARLGSGAESVAVAVAAVVEANAAIFQGAHRNAEQRGMGTTLTAIVLLTDPEAPSRLAVVNVGDSRAYAMRAGRLRRVSLDHSYVQELVSTGHITEAEARTHPRRNIVTRALGIEPTVRVDHWVLSLVRGDRYLLCSDGLVDEVDDDDIAAILVSSATPQLAADALVALANEHGGRDNVTVVVVDVLEGELPLDEDVHLQVDVDVDWVDDDRPDRLIDAEAGTVTGAASVRVRGVEPTVPLAAPVGPVTARLPVVAGGVRGGARRRVSVGGLLFGFALGGIAMLTVVLVLVVRHNANNNPQPTTTVSTPASTTSSTTPSTTTPSTTTPSTTTPSVTTTVTTTATTVAP